MQALFLFWGKILRFRLDGCFKIWYHVYNKSSRTGGKIMTNAQKIPAELHESGCTAGSKNRQQAGYGIIQVQRSVLRDAPF